MQYTFLYTLRLIGDEEVEEVFAEDYDEPAKPEAVLPITAIELPEILVEEEEDDEHTREV